jgi:malate dehydrogenase (oxaloacetate-decarboxylating)(NADP+)
MKLAAVYAIAKLAKEPVPGGVLDAYDLKALAFGPHYIIPKPLDMRVVPRVAVAVAEAAMKSGVARQTLNLAAYQTALTKRLSSP